MIMKIKTTVYDHSCNKEVPLFKLNTDTSTVYHFDEEKQEYVCFQFHTRYIHGHVRYTMQTYPERFQQLLDNGDGDNLRLHDLCVMQTQPNIKKPAPFRVMTA